MLFLCGFTDEQALSDKNALRRFLRKRNEGAAILLSSADLDEVFRLSDRIITLYEGKVTGEFNASEITKEEIGYYMTGKRDTEAAHA